MEINSATPMLTYTKKTVDITNLQPEDIELEDIAHGLSNLCRYNGATKRFYSVAEHCVRLAMHVDKREETEYNLNLTLACLLHDATEAYVGDIIYHLKRKMTEFSELEDQVGEAILESFGISEKVCSEVEQELHELDRRICFDEMYYLFDGHLDPSFYENRMIPLGESILVSPNDALGWDPQTAKTTYIDAINKTISKLKEKSNENRLA